MTVDACSERVQETPGLWAAFGLSGGAQFVIMVAPKQTIQGGFDRDRKKDVTEHVCLCSAYPRDDAGYWIYCFGCCC